MNPFTTFGRRTRDEARRAASSCVLSVALSLGLPTAGFAVQSAIVRGRAIEVSSEEPLAGATASLFASGDSLPLTSAVTDEDGVFVLEAEGSGAHYVSVSFIGLETRTTPRFALAGTVDLGILTLEPSPFLLEGLAVTGERPAVVREIDRIVYDVEDDVQAAGGSVSDILQNLPSISVGLDGTVALRGTPNVTIFINGRPSALLRRNAGAALTQLPASAVARVEIITNPSARFRPDGVGGIINIILRDKAGLGLDGRVGAHVGNESRYNGNVGLSVGTPALDASVNYGLRHANAGSAFTDTRVTGDVGSPLLARFEEQGSSRVDALSHNLSGDVTGRVDDRNSLELSGTYFYQGSQHAGLSEVTVINAQAQPILQFRTDESNDEFEREGEGALSFEHRFGEGEDHTLAVDGAYAGYREREDLAFREFHDVPASGLDVSRLLVRKKGTQAELSVDYSVPFGEQAELQAGYAAERIRDDIAYGEDLDRTRFLSDQDIHAWYGIFGYTFDRLSVQPGLRAELARITSHVLRPAGDRIPNNYSSLYPSVHAAYELTDESSIGLSYSKRINRPDADELNPNPEFSDPRNAEAGNANLRPEQVHSFEVRFVRDGARLTFAPTLYYRYTYDAFTEVQTRLDGDVILTTTDNLRTEAALGLETVISASVSDRLSLDLTGDVSRTRIDARNLGFSADRSVLTGSARALADYRPLAGVRFQLNGFYLFPQITPQGRRQSIAYLNAGIEVAIADGRGSVTLTGTDVFHSYRVRRTIDAADLSQSTRIRRSQPAFLLGMTWRFGASEAEPAIEFEETGVRR